MVKRLFTYLSISVVLLITFLAFCNGVTTASNSQTHWWDKFGPPKYGGTITIPSASLMPAFDASKLPGLVRNSLWFEPIFFHDWTLDRKIWDFKGFIPLEYWQGQLAERWDYPDMQTMIIHVRKGVKWQNKPPVNGREFTAKDLEYHFHRIFGLGSGFTKPSPFYMPFIANIESATANDKYTLVIKFKNSSITAKSLIEIPIRIQAQESVEAEGGLTDWTKAVGTGPWILKDFITGHSMVFEKNPDYYIFDERHPENRTPYLDRFNLVSIPDIATQLAAVRTGKIDYLADVPLQQSISLAKTNPEILQAKIPAASLNIDIRTDTKPFNDIRVRKSLEMSIDRQAIANGYYNGIVDGKPTGLISPDSQKGYTLPFDEWPADLKEGYSYNIEKARALLTEAGYPNGFKTNVVASSFADLELLEVIKSQFMELDVDMEIKVMERTAQEAFIQGGKHDQMATTGAGGGGGGAPPWRSLQLRSSNNRFNAAHVDDPVMNEFIKKTTTITDLEELKKTCIEADIYALSQYWNITVCPSAVFNVYQPYLKGYSGESAFEYYGQYAARFWKDK